MGIGTGHKAGGIRDDAPDLEFSYLRYGKHNLHRVGVWEQRRPAKPNATYWLMYVFGAARSISITPSKTSVLTRARATDSSTVELGETLATSPPISLPPSGI